VLDGRRPVGLRAAGGDPLLAGLYEDADAGTVDGEVLRALGVRTSVTALLDEPGGPAELLARLADPSLDVTPAQLHALYAELAALDPERVTLPDELRAVTADAAHTAVVDAADALVADAPDLLPLTGGRPLLPVPPRLAADLAELLQVRRLSEAVPAPVASTGHPHPVPAAVHDLLPTAPAEWIEHDELPSPPRTARGSRPTGAGPAPRCTPPPSKASPPPSPGPPATGTAASNSPRSLRTPPAPPNSPATAGSTDLPTRWRDPWRKGPLGGNRSHVTSVSRVGSVR
jgi:hypothetical protein